MDVTPLILLPGTLCDRRVFDSLLQHLPSLDFAAPDWGELNSTAAVADHLLAALPPRFALLGFSLGAIIALEIAARAPERVAGLALFNGTARDVPADRFAERRRAAETAGPHRDYVETTLWESYVAEHRLTDEKLKTAILDMAEASPAGALRRQTEIALSRADSRPRLRAMTAPCVVIGGGEDRVSPPALQEEMAALLPDASLNIIPDAGHFAPLEAPAACARAMDVWLAKIGALPAIDGDGARG